MRQSSAVIFMSAETPDKKPRDVCTRDSVLYLFMVNRHTSYFQLSSFALHLPLFLVLSFLRSVFRSSCLFFFALCCSFFPSHQASLSPSMSFAVNGEIAL